MFIKGPAPTAEMLKNLRTVTKKHDLLFIKLEPNVAVNFSIANSQFSNNHQLSAINHSKKKLVKLLQSHGAVPGKALFTPTSFWIDLTKSEEDLMKSFSSKTRYNIRLAQKRGVEVIEDNSDKAFAKYIKLTKETVKRQGFYSHTESYHRLMWKYLHHTPTAKHHTPIARLLTAKYKGEIITTWILFVWKNFLYYPYGASSLKHKNVMANNLMMWEAIRYGKKLGLKTFDLWGREPGKGFTKFKEGYHPQVVEFLGSWDLVTSQLYWPYRLADFIRWKTLRAKSILSNPTF